MRKLFHQLEKVYNPCILVYSGTQRNHQIKIIDFNFQKKVIFLMESSAFMMCAVHDIRVEGSSPSWADIERSIS